jgi:cytochrome c553
MPAVSHLYRFRHGIALGVALSLSSVAPTISAADAAAMLAAADPQRPGAKVLKRCAKCHLEEGVSDDPEVPHLAAQRASYMYKQLQDFKMDARDGGRMNKEARKLSDQEMADLSVLFAAKPLPAEAGVSVPTAPALVSAGDAARDVQACAECHGDDGRGKLDKYDAPALAGMPQPYFVLAMEAFREGDRANDRDGVMRKSAKTLSDQEIADLAGYYLALGQRKPLPFP